MCKEMPGIPLNRVVDPKRRINIKNGGPKRKRWKRRSTRGR
jgi:hypothetical protein